MMKQLYPLALIMLLGLALAAGCATMPQKHTEPAAPPAGAVLAPPLSQPLDQAGLQKRLDAAQVVLVGERHSHPGHHDIQLRVLKLMAAQGPVVVGIEWLDHSAQPACDRLSAGKISVEQFAQEADWKNRWGFDLKLYAPILEEVRLKGHRLVALNAPTKVVRQVARGGLKSLTPEQRAKLAPALDLDDPAYRAQIARQFAVHGVSDKKAQANFFAAQVARDDTMASNLARALEPWPDSGKRGLVLAGGGHLSHGLGLPPRIARRLPGVKLLTVMPVSAHAAQAMAHLKGARPADLLIVSTPAPPRGPRLGIIIKVEDSGLRIRRVLPDTPAQRAGLKAGDLLISVDQKPLKSPKGIHDAIKSAPYEPHTYHLRRGEREFDIQVTIDPPGEKK